MFDTAAYLRRIGYAGTVRPDDATLRALHRAHMFAVPFENLDIHLGRPITVDTGKFFDKIVTRRRGGFCYELNGLFAALLAELGFRVTLLAACVYDGDRRGPEFDHMTLLVDTGERWLADVGFGDSFTEPLRLDAPGEHAEGPDRYRIIREGEEYRLLRRSGDRPWAILYGFTLTPRTLAEFEPMCRWQQTSPDSHFTQKRVCSLATAGGRVTLSGDTLIITQGGERRERGVAGDEETARLLQQYFGVDLRL